MQEPSPIASTDSTQLDDRSLAPAYAATLSAENRRIVRICLAVLALLSTGSLIGVASSLYLVEHAPLLLIGLSPLGRHFVLAAPSVDPVAFVLVGVLRRLAFYTPCYFLGRALGPIALIWIETRARWFAPWVRWLEGLFKRSGRIVMLVMAGPTISTLAGISGMRLAPYLTLATLSLCFRLVFYYEFADAFREPIAEFLALLEGYRAPGTLLLVAGILVWQLIQRRRRPPAQLPPQ